MPILDVEIVDAPPPDDRRTWASAIADAAGELFGAPRGETWVRLRHLPGADYAESGGGPPTDIKPVFVHVLKAGLGSEEVLKRQAERLSCLVGDVCGRPTENVHVVFEPAGRGRVAFGGRLVPG